MEMVVKPNPPKWAAGECNQMTWLLPNLPFHEVFGSQRAGYRTSPEVLPLRDSAGLSPASPLKHLASGHKVHPL